MKTYIKISILFLSLILNSCNNKKEYKIKIDEVSPWCIIGFDSLNRTPIQRINMLKELGLKKYGYNRGKGDLSEMKKEFKLAQKNNIEITSVFLWLNAKRDSIGKLSASNQEILNNLNEMKSTPTIWVSFSNNFFKDLNQKQSIELAIQMITSIKIKTDQIGCKIAIYNHHGWFGNPHNQIEIIKKLKDNSITMVYNFHHAHEYVDEFPNIIKKIKPYLSYVNLNGVKKDGEKILPIGKGDYEFEMIKLLLDEGYKGPWGILGHIKSKDVQKVLEKNIEGIRTFNISY